MFSTKTQKIICLEVQDTLQQYKEVSGSFLGAAKDSAEATLNAVYDVEQLLKSMKSDYAVAQLKAETLLEVGMVTGALSYRPMHPDLKDETRKTPSRNKPRIVPRGSQN